MEKKMKCENCGKFHTNDCAFYCSKECCEEDYYAHGGNKAPDCPCY